MRSLLDDPSRISRVDRSDMLGSIYRFPEPLLHPQGFELRSVKRTRVPEGLVFAGMGGSASAADMLLDWLREKLEIPSQVSRDPKLPTTVSERTLVACISYSGETWETLQAFRQALKIGCQAAGVGSGGSLKALCVKNGLPFFQVSPEGAPRAALTKMMVAGCAALQSLGVVGPVQRTLPETGAELTRLREKLAPNVPSTSNRAKELALSLKGKTPMVYAFSEMGSVARRFKNQLAENSKVIAKFDLLPEACHNDIEGLENPPTTLAPLMVRNWKESSTESAVIGAFKSTIRSGGVRRVLEVREKAKSSLGMLLAPVLLLDYASAYLAILRGVDPSPTRRIIEYKRRYAATKTMQK